jgi:hypothetical protein
MDMNTSKRIIKRAGGQWLGLLESHTGDLVLFRDPVTGSTVAVKEDALTIDAAIQRLRETRAAFGFKA